MGRNKYPEITESRILEVAMKLFIEKGYEQTTLQDIADSIGMTRGAIYHHFKDKAEMVDTVMACMFHKTVPYEEIKNNKEISALEKIRDIIVHAVTANEQVDIYFPLSRSL
ncbi:MAG: TetR/AcrR family transcriptional regulator, partial [Hydrogeniiclostridium mannosilyticum]